MPPQVASDSLLPLPAVRVIESRHQYQPCHIQTPDVEARVAAIELDGKYYSFFRVEANQSAALKLASRLQQRGDVPIVTQIPKGYAIWVLEPDARRVSASTASYKILQEQNQYRLCYIRVPDLEKPLAAILFEGKYYSSFRTIEDLQPAQQIIQKLSHRGDKIVVTKTADGFGIWVLEPDATLAG